MKVDLTIRRLNVNWTLRWVGSEAVRAKGRTPTVRGRLSLVRSLQSADVGVARGARREGGPPSPRGSGAMADKSPRLRPSSRPCGTMADRSTRARRAWPRS